MKYYRENNINYYNSPIFSKKKYSRGTDLIRPARNNYWPINISLWMHGVGYTNKLRLSGRSSFTIIFSFVLSLICDLTMLLYLRFIISRMNVVKSSSIKRNSIRLFLVVFNLIIRFWMYTHRQKCSILVNRTAKVYNRIAPNMKLYLKRKVFLLIVVSDLISGLITVLNVLEFQNHKNPNKTVRRFVNGYIEQPASSSLYYFSLFMNFWSCIIPQIAVFFYLVCTTLKESFDEYVKLMRNSLPNDYDKLLKLHNEITDCISCANKLIHMPLLLTFIYSLTTTFYTAFYIVFFNVKNSYEMMRRISSMIWIDLCLILVCHSASIVSKSSLIVRDMVHSLPVTGENDSTRLCLVLKNENFAGFTFLDTIVINNRLLLEAFGLMLTYGMMIATFDASRQQ